MPRQLDNQRKCKGINQTNSVALALVLISSIHALHLHAVSPLYSIFPEARPASDHQLKPRDEMWRYLDKRMEK